MVAFGLTVTLIRLGFLRRAEVLFGQLCIPRVLMHLGKYVSLLSSEKTNKPKASDRPCSLRKGTMSLAICTSSKNRDELVSKDEIYKHGSSSLLSLNLCGLFYHYELSRIKYNSFNLCVVYGHVCALTSRRRHLFREAVNYQPIYITQWHPPPVNTKGTKNTEGRN